MQVAGCPEASVTVQVTLVLPTGNEAGALFVMASTPQLSVAVGVSTKLTLAEHCPASFDEYGLLCEGCGACCIGELSKMAESLGYAVLVAEGAGVVERLVARGAIDAVIGVSCMGSLERTFVQMSKYAVPGLAIPLLQDGCKDTTVPRDYIEQLIQLAPVAAACPPVDLRAVQREVEGWFDQQVLVQMIQPHDSEVDEIALEWLARDGKRWRPTLVASMYAAFAGCVSAGDLPESVRRVAVAVECIHKGSLIYDDIQDEDAIRYGASTIHRTHGVAMALTVALQLIGLGYKLMAECGAAPEVVQRLLALATTAHVDLCVGQGQDVGWLRDPHLLSADEVLELFRWKTAPSFEVVFLLGAMLADASPADEAAVRAYSLEAGVAYQIRDDLGDWTTDGDVDDIQMGRPCLMSALAVELSDGEHRGAVTDAWLHGGAGAAACIRDAIQTQGVEARAEELLAIYRQRAFDAIAELSCVNAKILLHRLGWRMLAPVMGS